MEGAHSGHSVMTIKKAIKIITDRIVESSKELQTFKNEINQREEGLKDFRQTLTAEQEERQNALKFMFEVFDVLT